MTSIDKKRIIQQTERFIQTIFLKEGSGHDWWHIHRVRKMAVFLAEKEGGDRFIIELAALLHDLDDWKITDSDSGKTEKWLTRIKLPIPETKNILQIIEQVLFKGAAVETKATSIEAKIVQDADRLDAIGAIGIARTFTYGGNKERLIYDPQIRPEMHTSFDAYKKSNAPTINHFYEKLLLLKDLMNTETAKMIAIQRHRFMELFLETFFCEWNIEAD